MNNCKDCKFFYEGQQNFMREGDKLDGVCVKDHNHKLKDSECDAEGIPFSPKGE